MAITKLITAAEVKTLAFANAQFDLGYLLDTYIEVCQYSYFYEKLGKDFYNELLTQKAADDLSEANATLLTDYLKPALAFYVKAKILPDVHHKTGNAGVFNNTGENFQEAGDKGLSSAISNAMSIAESKRSQMIDFLEDEDNEADYPTYHTSDDPPLSVNESGQVIGGIILGGRYSRTDKCKGCDCEGECRYNNCE